VAKSGEHCRRWYETKDEQRIRIARSLMAAARGQPKQVYGSEQEANDSMAKLYIALTAMMGGD
jgi:hypothetical protein